MDAVAERKTKLTINDIQLATAYYPILVDVAKNTDKPITYGELIERAKLKNPNNEIVQNAIAVSAGRKLAAVREFTDSQNYPDLASMVVGKGTGECGSGYTKNFDPEKERERVRTFDWSNVSMEFNLHMNGLVKALTPLKRRKKEVAVRLMSEFYFRNKQNLPVTIDSQRDQIIELLMNGLSVEDAFDECKNSAR